MTKTLSNYMLLFPLIVVAGWIFKRNIVPICTTIADFGSELVDTLIKIVPLSLTLTRFQYFLLFPRS